MANRFLSRGSSKNNDEDDLVKRQLSALGDADDSNDSGENDAADTKAGVFAVTEPSAEVEKKSVLQQGMVVTGSVSSQTAMYVYGTVNGDIVCESDVTIDGNVDGNVKAASIQVMSGHVNGDIECKSGVAILKDAVIKGNVHGESLNCDGKVEGNTIVSRKAAIKENAVILGNIACEKISISEGAVCKGNIQTNAASSKKAAEASTQKLENNGGTKPETGNVTDLKKYV